MSAWQNVERIDLAAQARCLPGVKAGIHADINDTTAKGTVHGCRPLAKEKVDCKGDLLMAIEPSAARKKINRRRPPAVEERQYECR